MTRDREIDAAPEVHDGEVIAPPTTPTSSRVVWSMDEIADLPEGTLITWLVEGSSRDADRHAAVICDGERGEKWIRHTCSDYWVSRPEEVVMFPVLAFVWAEEPSVSDSTRHQTDIRSR